MKCHIVRDGGCMLLILCLSISIANSAISESVYTIQEFCSGNLYIHNVEPGDSYQLTLKATSAVISKWYQKSKRKCRKEFKTSDPASHFVVLISNMTIPSCLNCRCNFFEISVLGHKKRYCGSSETEYFSSKSDKISIEFFHGGKDFQFDVTFAFSVERNFYVVNGVPSDHSLDAGSFIETPYFPIPYPPNYRAEFRLQSDFKNSYVVLLFLDFQISGHSFIEVVGNNGTHPTKFHGSTFRPPVIVSQSNFLDLKFESNNQLGMSGFRALCSFIKNIDSLSVPYTDCGGPNKGRVGSMNIKTHETFSLYDCVWHINAFMPFFSSKSYLSVSVQMKDIGHKSMLEFRDGLDSKSPAVKVINCETEDCSNLDVELTIPASSNLYIRFSGYLDVYSIVNMTYSAYHTGNCSKHEFMCDDGRCLLSYFQCDGIKQCPSGIDEEQCPTSTPKVEVSSISNIRNEGAPDNTAHKFYIICIVGGLGLVAVFVAVFLFMYKYYKVIPANVEQAQSQINGDMSDIQPILYPNNMYDSDNPPSYDDFMKSSDCFPPLLYSRAKQRLNPNDMCAKCTTSFSTGTRPRHHSANSFSFRSSDTDSEIFVHNSMDVPPQTSSNCCSVEILNSHANRAPENIRKWYSLDSKLNDLAKQDTCHLFLSIIHPVCNHASDHLTHVQCHTFPRDAKTSNAAAKMNAAAWPPTSSFRAPPDRRCTWSFMPHNLSSSEILTVVKTRCCSDPCKGISVHYSLHK